MVFNRRFLIGLIVTLTFLALLFVRVDLPDLGRAFASANYAYLVPGIAIYFVSLYFRSLRWRFLLRPFATIPTRRLYPVVLVGYMANNVLPVRLGELVRSYYLSTREPVRGSTALATVVVERVFDGLTLLLFLAAVATVLPVGALAVDVGDRVHIPVGVVAAIVVAPFALALATIAALALAPAFAVRLAAAVTSRLPATIGQKVLQLLERFLRGFHGLHQPRKLVGVLVLSIPIWLAEAAMYYVVAIGFDLRATLGGAGTMVGAMIAVTAVSNLATSLPSSQGSVGPFEFFAASALVFLGVGTGVASAYAVVLHAALLLPVIAAGLLHLAANGALGVLGGKGARGPWGSLRSEAEQDLQYDEEMGRWGEGGAGELGAGEPEANLEPRLSPGQARTLNPGFRRGRH